MLRIASTAVLLALSAVATAGFNPSRTPVGPSGTRATVDLPASQHMKNVGGSDGLGLCVFTSLEHSARWQNIIDLLGYRRWMERRPGGGYPSKVTATLKAFCQEKGVPVPEYIQHTGGDDSFLDLAMRTGRCPAVTYAGSDDFYRGGIDHMVNLVYLDQSSAAILDNNRPGTWLWMTRGEFLQRWRARGGGWAVVFLSPPPPPHNGTPQQAAADCNCGSGGVCMCEGCPGCACEKCCCRGRPPTETVFGQCLPGGACPAPSAGRPIPHPFSFPAAPVAPKWSKHGNYLYLEGRGLYDAQSGLWAPLWRKFDDASWAEWGPWQHLPAGIVPPKPVVPAVPQAQATPGSTAGDEPLTGVVPEKIHDSPLYSLSGNPVTKEEAHAALAGGLVDDSDRWHVSIVGSKDFIAKVKGDLAKLPETVKQKFHVQAYTTDNWAVAAFKLKEGVTLRKDAGMSRVSSEAAAIAAADYSADALNKMCPFAPKPPTPPTPPTPDPNAPPAPPAPVNPNPVPWWAIMVALVAVLFLPRRK